MNDEAAMHLYDALSAATDKMPTPRERFAAAALAGLLAAHAGEGIAMPEDDWAAVRAWRYADALLAAERGPQ